MKLLVKAFVKGTNLMALILIDFFGRSQIKLKSIILYNLRFTRLSPILHLTKYNIIH